MLIKVEEKLADEKSISITVYGDFNCPYCFALNERLESMGLSAAVNWLLVEHAPDLYKHSFSDIDKQELIQEVNDVHARAPNVELNLPVTRPNSRQASLLFATVLRTYPAAAIKVRTAIYRALWQQGQDISDPEVLTPLLLSIGLPRITIDPGTQTGAQKDLQAWHSAWQQGQFARNIPSMESSRGFKLLGFPNSEQLTQFIEQGRTKVTDFQDASCVLSERYSIAVISERGCEWAGPALLDAISSYYYFESEASFMTAAPGLYSLDMIILNNSRSESVNIIRLLKYSSATQYIPVFLLSDDENIQIEAYRSGVADVACSDINEEILGHRMVRILRSKRSTDKLYEIARIDFLTGLFNRREFDIIIEREWRQRRRENTPLSLLMIDLDSFKTYNDTYGHSMGDEVLQRFARILESCANRPSDLVVRYGGEEFAVILPNVDLDGAVHVAELIREQTEKHDIEHKASVVSPHITVSIGVAEAKGESKISVAELVDKADKALYRAKENGRNRVCT